MHLDPISVKVVKVEGRPYLCTVYPPVPPRPEDDVWGQKVRSHSPHRYTGDDENVSTSLNYAQTKFDQEN